MKILSSTNKTEKLNLNNWSGSDIPKREDFNYDNSTLDSVLGGHIEDEIVHITSTERSKWNQPYYMGTYVGNGSNSRNITLNCNFNPSWGIIFAVNLLPHLNDYNNKADYNYFGLVSSNGSTIGVSLNNKTLTVVQSATPVSGVEYRSYNENGTIYVYIMFR